MLLGGNHIYKNNQLNTETNAFYALQKALSLCERNGIATYDPFDIKGIPLVLWTYSKPSLIKQAVRLSLYGSTLMFPILTRKLFRVSPMSSASGVALLANTYCLMYELTQDDLWIKKSRYLLEWLEMNKANTNIGEGWGLPFDWQSFKVIPAGTPTSYTSMQCAEAFLAYYKITKDEWALNHIINIGEFLSKGLNILESPSGFMALSYTPIDENIVINVNASVANILILIGNLTKQKSYCEMGINLLPFILESQKHDGSWNYSLSEKSLVDGYHTGMIIDSVISIYGELNESHVIQQKCEVVITKGITYYLEKLFSQEGISLMYPDKLYPLDIYSFSQAIITLNTINNKCTFIIDEQRIKTETLIHQVVNKAISLMMEANGAFTYRKYRFKKLKLFSLRWAQAPMCLALANYYNAYYNDNNKIT